MGYEMFIAPTTCQAVFWALYTPWHMVFHSPQFADEIPEAGSAITWSSSYCQRVDKSGLSPLVSDPEAYLSVSHCTPKVECAFSLSGMIQGAVSWVMRRSELGPTHRAL